MKPLHLLLTLAGLLSALNVAGADDAPGLVPAGLARLDITPAGPIQLINVKQPVESRSVVQKLYARALVIGEDENAVVLVGFDGIGVPSSLTQRVAQRLEDSHGIARERIALCATHTHWAPHLTDLLPNIYGGPLPAEQQRRVDAYTDRLVELLHDVAVRALTARRPSRLSWSTGRVGFAVNRRLEADGRLLRDPSKRLMVTWNPNAPTDHALPVITIRDAATGQLRGIHFSYACHNVALASTSISGFENSIHGDWAGLAQQALEARFPDSIALCTIGCGGDQRPNFCGDLSVAEAHAQEIRGEIERMIARAKWEPVGPPVEARTARTELPLGPIASIPELERFASDPSDTPSVVARAMVARKRLEQLRAEGRAPGGVPFLAQAWRFDQGPTLLFLTGEVCIDYQRRIKSEFGEHCWPIAYANATPCYVVSRRMLEKGGYEAGNSMFYYGWLRSLQPEAEDTVMQCIADTLRTESPERTVPPPP